MLALGVSAVIVGTMAVKNPDVLEKLLKKYTEEQIILGIDARNRKVSVEGWKEDTEIQDVKFALRWKKFWNKESGFYRYFPRRNVKRAKFGGTS